MEVPHIPCANFPKLSKPRNSWPKPSNGPSSTGCFKSPKFAKPPTRPMPRSTSSPKTSNRAGTMSLNLLTRNPPAKPKKLPRIPQKENLLATRPLIEKVKAADAAAHRARRDAEETFEVAERQLNLDLAREGCKKAIHSWELHEKAIRLAEELLEATQPQS